MRLVQDLACGLLIFFILDEREDIFAGGNFPARKKIFQKQKIIMENFFEWTTLV